VGVHCRTDSRGIGRWFRRRSSAVSPVVVVQVICFTQTKAKAQLGVVRTKQIVGIGVV
jgi:hypothetical protein